jgi:hypothetical protein
MNTCVVSYKKRRESVQVSKIFARQTVYDALVDCYNQTQRDVTRETLREITGLKQVTVDEHLRQLIDVDQTVERRRRGYFRPAAVFPESRAVSCTVLTSGMAKIEIGDICIDLTPAEARKLAPMLGGGAIGYYGADKAIEGGRSLAGVNTSAPADRAPGFFTNAPGPIAKMAGNSNAGAGRGVVNPTAQDVAGAQAAMAEPPAANPNQINVTREPSGTMSFSGGPNIGKDGGDISYTGNSGFKPSGAGVTVMPGASFANGSPASDSALAAARMAAADRGDFGAVRDSYFAQGQGFGGETKDSMANDRLREIALSPAGTPGRKAALQMFGDQASATTTRQAQQATNDIAKQELGIKQTAAGFTSRAAARVESLQAAYETAKPEERSAIAEQLRVLTGKDKTDQFMGISGGQQIDANGVPYKTPDRVFDKTNRAFIEQGATQAAKPAVQEGSVSEVNGKKAKFTSGKWVPF